MSLIKFCGLFQDDDIIYANKLKPDFIGFVFAESRRKVSIEKSIHLKSMLDKNIKSVGVFLNNTYDEIINICSKNIIDIIQIHGNISDEFIDKLKSDTNKIVIKALNIKDLSDILSLEESHADYVLIDSKKAGSGIKFDYSILEAAKSKGFNRDYFLAGGINIKNIDEALSMKPYCIDISSGIEKDGVKNYKLMEEIINKVRRSI